MAKGFDKYRKNLYIKYIDDDVEFGLFTNEIIQKGTILGRWSGVVQEYRDK